MGIQQNSSGKLQQKMGLEFGWFELTKFYEHQERNYPEALEYAEKLLEFISNQNLAAIFKAAAH